MSTRRRLGDRAATRRSCASSTTRDPRPPCAGSARPRGGPARQASLTQNTAARSSASWSANGWCGRRKRFGARGQRRRCLAQRRRGLLDRHPARPASLVRLLIDFSGQCWRPARTSAPSRCPRRRSGSARGSRHSARRSRPGGRSRLAGVGLAIPYNLGSWRRELTSRARPTRPGRFRHRRPAARGERPAAAGREPRHGGRGGGAVPGPRPRARRFRLPLHRRPSAGVVLGGDYRRGVTGNAGDIGLMPVRR